MNYQRELFTGSVNRHLQTVMARTDEFGMGKRGKRISAWIGEHSEEFGRDWFLGLETAANAYNNLAICDTAGGVLQASLLLKPKIGRLVTPSEVFKESSDRGHIVLWSERFKGASENLTRLIIAKKLKWFNDETSLGALSTGLAVHFYEELMKVLTGKLDLETDEVVDAVMEMLLLKNPDAPMAQRLHNPKSLESWGGMDWLQNYDHLHPKIRERHRILY